LVGGVNDVLEVPAMPRSSTHSLREIAYNANLVDYSAVLLFAKDLEHDVSFYVALGFAAILILLKGATRERVSPQNENESLKLPERKEKPTGVHCWELFPQFAKYDLEDSLLLDVREGDSIQFTVDAALTEAHPLAKEGSGWRKILIVFPNVRSLHWIEKDMRPYVELDGSINYGDVHYFLVEGNKSHLGGEWGDVEIVSDPPEVREIEEP
jgi:hypothetical protein